MKKYGRTLTVLIIVVVLAAVGSLLYVVLEPAQIESYTEFYLLDPQTHQAVYPQAVAVGQEVTVLVGIVNHEKSAEAYRVEMQVAGRTTAAVGERTIENGETYEQPVMFSFDQPGPQQEVDFFLYMTGQTDVYRSLRLVLSVNGQG
jgi:uncharacterized membrane protein